MQLKKRTNVNMVDRKVTTAETSLDGCTNDPSEEIAFDGNESSYQLRQ